MFMKLQKTLGIKYVPVGKVMLNFCLSVYIGMSPKIAERGIVQLNASPECIVHFGTGSSGWFFDMQILSPNFVGYCRNKI